MTNNGAPQLTLTPAMPAECPPAWAGAVWIGELRVEDFDAAVRTSQSAALPVTCRLEAGEGFHRARLLVRSGDRTLGFVKIVASEGRVDFVELKAKVDALRSAVVTTAGASRADHEQTPAVTVVVCTRDRPALLRTAVESVLALDYPNFELIVVDNASKTDATRTHILGHPDPRVRLIHEPRPGVSRARNAGLLAAESDLVAFADDDVVVDRHWLRALVAGFGRGTSVSCVSGLVPAGEIRTPAQAYFDRRVGWSVSTEPRVFEWSRPPADIPLFPFAVGSYGTGANFAVEREVIIGLGGFDEALGAGVPTGGGEDIDLFFRVLRSGRQLVHEPAAIVWHRHRPDSAGLLAQTCNYDVGLGAWLGKIMGEPEIAGLAVTTALRRGPAFVRHIRSAARKSAPPVDVAAELSADLGGATWRSLGRGVWTYWSARRAGHSAQPLPAAPSGRTGP